MRGVELQRARVVANGGIWPGRSQLRRTLANHHRAAGIHRDSAWPVVQVGPGENIWIDIVHQSADSAAFADLQAAWCPTRRGISDHRLRGGRAQNAQVSHL